METRVAAGESFTCATRGDVFRCWGSGLATGYGLDVVIGDDEVPASVAPPAVAPGRIVQMAAGSGVMCAVWSGGDARCWGDNRDGGLGYGHGEDIGDDEALDSLAPLPFGRAVLKIATTGDHACALLDGGKVRCWGENGSGELGYGHTNTLGDDEDVGAIPDVDLGGDAIDIAVAGVVSCALLSGGAVRCWGDNENGVLGNEPYENYGDDEVPADVAPIDLGGRKATQIALGGLGDKLASEDFVHLCVLLDDGAVRCWGSNAVGELGYGHTNYVNGPPSNLDNVSLGQRAVELVAAALETCALTDDGRVLCWGSGSFGQLGHPLAPGCLDDGGLADCGFDSSCCIGDDEVLSGAGPVDLPEPAVQIAVGGFHVCAVLASGAIACWGQGRDGALGYGNTEDVGDDEPPSAAGYVDVF